MIDDDRTPEQDQTGQTPTQALPTPDTTPTSVLPGLAAEPDASPTAVPPGLAADTIAADAPATATALLPHPRIAPYVEAARGLLADLPAGERSELLDDLDAHLHEILAEEGEAFETRLGAPADYAAEFRASAGYPPLVGQPDAGPRTSRARRWGRRVGERWAATSDSTAQAVRGLPGGPALLALLPRLRPAWWVFRAWLVAAVLGVDWPTGHYSGIGWWGALAWQVALVVASVAWGLRTERRRHQGPGRGRRLERVGLGVLNGYAVACCALAVLGAGPIVQPSSIEYVAGDEGYAEPVPIDQTGVWLDGAPVTNFVGYDLAGKPIEGFQLFDQDGRPVSIDESQHPGLDDAWVYPVPVTTSNGTPVTNVFPIRRVTTDGADAYYCDETAMDDDGLCDPYALATVQGEQPLPSGSPWKDLTVTQVPAVGSTLPFDESLNPIWSGVTAPEVSGAPSPSPIPSESPSGEAAADSPSSPAADEPSASAKAKKPEEKPAEGPADEE